MSNKLSTRLAATLVAGAMTVSGCNTIEEAAAPESESETTTSQNVFDSSSIHTISIDFDEDDYEEIVTIYLNSSEKEWIEAAITINGTTYEKAGIRMKGNSSLQRLSGGENGGFDTPSGVPWLIRLDKFVDGQTHEGISDFVVRSSGSETAINEAISLDLLGAAELATQDAIAVRFSVNDSDETLRLVIEHPDDSWMAKNFDDSDALYKAESTGDYSYRGENEELYDEVFDQEAGKANADLAPLIEFLDFINNTDDATFAAEIEQRLDVEAFATYLAINETIGNEDDIDGPGNNSYLHWDFETGQFTVLPWDYNEAFGWAGGTQRGAAVQESRNQPVLRSEELVDDRLSRRGRNNNQSNILVERFLAVEEFSDVYENKLASLQNDLIESGEAQKIVARWVDVLSEASDLVDTATVETEASYVNAYLQ